MDFKFNFDKLLGKTVEKAKKHVDGITIKLPFISFSIKPTDIERKAAVKIKESECGYTHNKIIFGISGQEFG